MAAVAALLPTSTKATASRAATVPLRVSSTPFRLANSARVAAAMSYTIAPVLPVSYLRRREGMAGHAPLRRFSKSDYARGFPMQNYEAKQNARRGNLLARAAKKRKTAEELARRSSELVEDIPMGQPILVGHHSEGRHRRTLERSQKAMSKSVDLHSEARELERRAAAVGTGGIRSDDATAVDQLRQNLALLVDMQDTMKRINRHYKKGGWDAVQDMTDEEKEHAKAALARDWRQHPRPYESYQLANNNANIRRIKQRIKALEAREGFQDSREAFDGYALMVDTHDNRVRIEFDGKPNRATCQFMRKNGFVFSRQHMAWQRQLNLGGLNVGKRSAVKLADMTLFD